MSKATAPTELAARLAALDIDAAEVAVIVGRPVEDVEAWVAGDGEPDGEARILLRIFIDPDREHAAQLAAQRVRDTYTANLAGDAVRAAGIETPPYGSGHQGETGGTPE